MVEKMLKALRMDLELGGKIGVQILDQGDAVGVWYNESLSVVLFPTGDTLPKVSAKICVSVLGRVVLGLKMIDLIYPILSINLNETELWRLSAFSTVLHVCPQRLMHQCTV